MQTERLPIDPAHLDDAEAQNALNRAAQILAAGGLVALPTETVYGLGAHALDAAAVARIFEAKKRPSWDPVIVHLAGPATAENAMLQRIAADVPAAAQKLIEAFWPGPLTLLLPRTSDVPDAVTAGRPLVGVRMPAHPVAFRLIEKAGVPIAAPSANLFSHISPTTAAHVLADLDGRIDAVLDAGPSVFGLESTVLDACQSPMVIYRPGAVTAEQIRAVAGDVVLYQAPEQLSQAPQALPSPGVGIRHYAPRARLVLVEASSDQLSKAIADAAQASGAKRAGVMLPEGAAAPPGSVAFAWGRWSDIEELARRLYAGLRALDDEHCDVIVCPLPAESGVGMALRDRLGKAARQAETPRG